MTRHASSSDLDRVYRRVYLGGQQSCQATHGMLLDGEQLWGQLRLVAVVTVLVIVAWAVGRRS